MIPACANPIKRQLVIRAWCYACGQQQTNHRMSALPIRDPTYLTP